MGDRILKSLWLHPVRWMFAIVLVVISLFVIWSGEDTDRPQVTSTNTPVTEEEIDQEPASPNSLIESSQTPDSPDQPAKEPANSPATDQDPNNRDPVADETEENVLEGKEIAAERAALPFLPVKTGTIEGEYKTQLSNGLLLVEVRYRASKEKAIKDWQDFLDKYQDPGTAYLVVYKPAWS